MRALLRNVGLPRNSKIGRGKIWPAPEGARRAKAFEIYRFDPIGTRVPGSTPITSISTNAAPMVLDALFFIKNRIDSTLVFRRSCREGVCGSCSMNIDGTNTIACTKADQRY